MAAIIRKLPTMLIISGIAMLLGSGNAVAEMPNNLADIPYQSTDWGSEQLRFRGYTLIHSDHHHGKTWEYWWQGNANTCIQAQADHGKYEALKVTSSTDCNQYHQQAIKNNNAAAVAVAAAALLTTPNLAHKSHHREGKHSQSEKDIAEFERGYRDGLHHESYHNYQKTEAYSDGYTAGQSERDEQTVHHSHDGRHSGYHPYVSLNDLVGAKASSADSDLRSRGFTDTGGYKQGDKSFVTWYNADTHQCLQAVTKEGRIKSLESIYEGNCQ